MMISCSSQKPIQKNELIYYGKTACLGKCPVFDLYIYEDGKVVYQGFKNVEKKGKFITTKILKNQKSITCILCIFVCLFYIVF